MRKFQPWILAGILLFSLRHVVKPAARGTVKAVKTAVRVIV